MEIRIRIMHYSPNIEQTAEDTVIVGRDCSFERIRRITGYLAGTLDRFNNAKRAEERDRLKHGMDRRARVMNGGK
jgi:hypothetical protein